MSEAFHMMSMHAVDPMWESALLLARVYHEVCDGFDETVCTGKDEKDVPMPVGSYEQILVNRHAKKVRAFIDNHANRVGIPMGMMRQAILKVAANDER